MSHCHPQSYHTAWCVRVCVFSLQIKTHWCSVRIIVAQWGKKKTRPGQKMRTISLQTLVLLVWILDCVPANSCKKKRKKSYFHPSLTLSSVWVCVSHSGALTETLCKTLDSDLLQASAFLVRRAWWNRRVTEQNWIRSTCQVVCAYVTCRRQMRRFCRVFRASPLCVYNLSSCLTVTQVKCWETQKLASLTRSRLQETNQVSLHLPRSQVSLCSLLCNTVHKSALVVYLVSIYTSTM